MRGVFLFTISVLLHAGPAKLVATAAGDTLYFELRSGLVDTTWYRLDVASRAVALLPQDVSVHATQLEVSGDGLTLAQSGKWQKLCFWPGSSCSVARSCRASTSLSGPISDVWRYDGRDSFVRLSPDSSLAWIEPASFGCSLFNPSPPPAIHGLVDVRSKNVIRPGDGFTLVNTTPGRRMMTSTGRILVRSTLPEDGGVYLLSTHGEALPLRAIPTGATDVVMDASGCTFAYRFGDKLHLWACDQDIWWPLEFDGSLPALSADGRYLVYRNARSELAVYDRATRQSVTGLLDAPVESFTLGGGYVFASVADGRILRMALDNGAVDTLLPTMPEIETVHLDRAAIEATYQTPAYYGPAEPVFRGRPGTVALVRFRNPVAADGWSVRFESGTVELQRWPGDVRAHWFQLPYDERLSVTLVHPDYPAVRPHIHIQTPDWPYGPGSFVRCLGIYHKTLDRPVTAADPARIGESLRVALTGLPVAPQAEWMAPYPSDATLVEDNTPLTLADSSAARTVSSGVWSGSVGLQFLDFTLVAPFAGNELFAGTGAPAGCLAPDVQLLPLSQR